MTRTVPVVIHLDHGSSLEQVMGAIRAGFTSVMMDKSMLPLEENIAACRAITDLAHAVNVSVEGELGTIGELDEEAEAGADEVIFVDPEHVKMFVDATDVDTLAVAIGTSHGLYPKDMKPEIRLDSAARHQRESRYSARAAWRVRQSGRGESHRRLRFRYLQDQHLRRYEKCLLSDSARRSCRIQFCASQAVSTRPALTR